MAWLRLIRWQNLLIIFFTQFIAWKFVLEPQRIAHSSRLFFNVDFLNFLCISLSTILIAAAGYIINDYFDVNIDQINHPNKVLLGNKIHLKEGIKAHLFLNFIALCLSSYVAYSSHHLEWILVQVFCITLLWYYSTHFKRQLLIGNIVVALLVALTMVVLVIYQPFLHGISTDVQPIIQNIHEIDYSFVIAQSSIPVWVLGIYTYFAFMLTLIREIVKDIEDFKGDEKEGCRTLPVVMGIQFARRTILAISILTITSLIFAAMFLFVFQYYLLAGYFSCLLILPVLVWVIYLLKSKDVSHYHKASQGLKIIMVLGICTLIIYHYQLN